MRKQIIYENQVGLLLQNGRIVREVGAGVYRIFSLINQSVVIYPTAPQVYSVSGNFSTSDMASIQVDVSVNIYIRDTRKHYLSGVSIYEAVNRAFAKLVQAHIGNKSFAEVLAEPVSIAADELNREVAENGIEVSVEGVPRIRLPRNLQNAIDAQEVARQRAKAELEEARGRTAVLRHYANAAKMTKDNPELLRLLLGQKAKSISVAFDAAK